MTRPADEHDFTAARRRWKAEAIRQVCLTPRYRCRYFLWGTGPPLVFVHGLGDRAESFLAVMARLIDRFTCLGFDLADGLGDGARLGAYHHRHHVEDLIRLLDHVGFGRADVLGSSYGTTIVLKALESSPDRFRKAVLQGGFARRPLQWFERGPARVTRFWPGRIGDVPGRRIVLTRLDRATFSDVPPEAFHTFAACTGRTPIAALTRRALSLDRLDLRPLLSDIPHPVLLVGGNNDLVVPQEFQRDLDRGLRNARRITLDRCGHYPQYTHPAALADAIRSFLPA